MCISPYGQSQNIYFMLYYVDKVRLKNLSKQNKKVLGQGQGCCNYSLSICSNLSNIVNILSFDFTLFYLQFVRFYLWPKEGGPFMNISMDTLLLNIFSHNVKVSSHLQQCECDGKVIFLLTTLKYTKYILPITRPYKL